MIYIIVILVLIYCIKGLIFTIIWKEETVTKIERTPEGYLKDVIDKDRRVFTRRNR